MTTQRTKQSVFRLLSVRGTGLFTVGGIILSALTVCVPWLLGAFIDAIVRQNAAVFIFILLTTTALSAAFLDSFLKLLLTKLTRRLEIQLQDKLLDQFCQLTPSEIDKYRVGEIGMKFFRDVPNCSMFLRDFYPQILSTVFSVLFALIAAFYSNWIIGAVFLLTLPIQILIVLPYKSKYSKYNHLYRKINDFGFNRIFEFFHVFPFLKSQAAEEPYKEIPQFQLRRVADFSLRKNQFDIRFSLVLRLMTFLSEYSVLGTAGFLAWNGTIPVGQVVFYQGLFLSVLNSFSGFFRLLPMWENIQESVVSMNELLDSSNVENDSDKKKAPVLSGSIEIRDVTFRYKNSDRDVLSHFSEFIPAGSLVAIEGKNGAGKTTVLKLLTAYMEPTSGEIFFDGQPLSKLNKASVRSQIGVVFQEFLLITGTMLQNVTLKNKKYSLNDIEKAVSLSCLDTALARFPEGLKHKIGFDGGNLSGGECQKLAIARALIRQPRILVLDEVMNHLDRDSKNKIKDLLLSLHGKITILLVSHDQEIISLCDKVISLD